MTIEEFQQDYLHDHPVSSPIIIAQLMVDEITPTTDYEIEMISAAQDYLTAARKLYRSSAKLGIEVFA